MKEAVFYEKRDNYIKCRLCPIGCEISAGSSGFCKIRTNVTGILYAEHYGLITSLAIDPIEKKPLCRFRPGSRILSIGGYSCNLRCSFCQNHEISMGKPAQEYLSPDDVVALALKHIHNGNIGIAYTYNEPFINYEYLLDCCMLAKERGLSNVIVTNGYVNEEPLRNILPYTDAMNIDLKGGEDFYKNIKGGLDDVKRTISIASEHCHVEVTTLVIPGENDDPKDFEAAVSWLSSVSPHIPLHLSRFFPSHLMTDKQPTPKSTLFELKEIAEKYLRYVRIGNI